jgi:NAD-dependent DNA ligase
MSHIFISYSSKDRSTTKKLVAVFEKQGWKVWWDKNLKPGKAFDTAISKALDAASCIVVLWSPNSVESNWVLEEAYEGLNRDILAPVLIKATRLPFGYRRTQYIDLSKWKGVAGDVAIKNLLAAIEPFAAPEKKIISAKSGASKPSKKKPAKATKPKPKPKSKTKIIRTFSGGLDGKNIVFTGALLESRNVHAEKVKAVGANYVSTISGKTDYLVVGKEPGASKLAAAKKQEVKKITEKTWLKMLNETYRRTFVNKRVVFTGKLNAPRKELEKLVKSIGAKPTNDISGKTDYLIVGDKPGKVKLAAAEKFSVKIIKEELWKKIMETL